MNSVITAPTAVLPTLVNLDYPVAAKVESDMADLVVAYLNQIGVEYVFGVPGGAIEPLYNAMARSERSGGLRHVLARHEASAAFMADGYARETGKIGVCCATSGPGATNLITGVANAYENNIPMLVLTGQPALPTFGKHPLQDSSCTGVNILGMFEHCTTYNSFVSHAAQVETKLIAALQSCSRAPNGPAHLTFPADVFRAQHNSSTPNYDLKHLLRMSKGFDADEIDRLYNALARATKTVIVIGGRAGEASTQLLELATRFNIPYVATPDGKGFVNPTHRLFRGVIGFGGHGLATETLADPTVDLILAFGTSMGEWNTAGWSPSLLNSRLIHIDECETHLMRTPMARLHVRGNLAAIVAALAIQAQFGLPQHQVLSVKSSVSTYVDDMRSTLCTEAPMKPQRLMRDLSGMFPINTVYLADTGNSVAWATHYLNPSFPRKTEHSKGWLRVTMNWAAMGWAIGGAVGTALGNPEAPVVCITGDGSMLMNGQEVSVAVAERLKIVFIVLNDSALGMVMHGQRLAGAEQTGCLMPPTDFSLIARGLGAKGFVVHSSKELAEIDLHDLTGPVVIDVRIDPTQVPPMKSRIKTLAAQTA